MRRLSIVMLLFTAACGSSPTPAPKAAELVPPAPEATTAVAVRVERTEVRVTLERGSATTERREVYRVMSSNPPEAWANVYAHWRPWMDEAPELSATVVRPDGTVTQLDPSTISDQAEPRDDGLIVDSRIRLAPLPGLTPGAVVDRRAVTTTRDFLVEGQASDFWLGTSQPEAMRTIVIDAPADMPLTWEAIHSDIEPTREERDGRVLLTFERGPAQPSEGVELLAPRELAREPVLRISTVRSWRDAAAAWAARADEQIDVSAVQTIARELVVGQKTRAARIQALLAWLRKNVRYTGLELGEAAWVPTSTKDVLERRFGDCKDLSLMLVALMRAVGIPADVALVRTHGADVTSGTPGLSLFDHAIVRVERPEPALWIDPTVPFAALGEIPWALEGRRALVARKERGELATVTGTGRSTLDSTVEVFLQEDGPARVVRTRRSEGIAFSETREVAANSMDAYEEALEEYVREGHDSEKPVRVEASNPFAAGRFEEVLEVEDSVLGHTDGDTASYNLQLDYATAPLSGLFYLAENTTLEEREHPVLLPRPALATVTNVMHPPPGFTMEDLPADLAATVGPIQVALNWRRANDDTVTAVLHLETGTGTLAPDEAKRFMDDVVPKFAGVRVRFKNAVLEELRKERLHSAVERAEAVLRDHPTPAARAQLAYALSTATLQESALAEARRALAEAPDHVLVRNRVAYVLLHNERGIEFGPGYPRNEALAVIDGTIERFPDNEWARRLKIIVSRYDADGMFDTEAVDRAGLLDEIRAYKERTESGEFDDTLVELLIRKRAWKELLDEAPKMEQSAARDAAWLAADLVVNQDLEACMRRASTEQRFADQTLALTSQFLLSSRQYQATAALFEWIDKRTGNPQARTFAQMVEQLAPCEVPESDPLRPLIELTRAGLERKTDNLDHLFTEPPDARTREGLLAVFNEIAQKSDMAAFDLSTLTCDMMASTMRADMQSVKGFGELVTFRTDIPGLTPPTPLLMRKVKGRWRVVPEPEPAMAAAGLRALGKQNTERAHELFRAIVRLSLAPPSTLKNEGAGWAETVPFYAARIAAESEETAAEAIRWTEKQLKRSGLTELQIIMAARALSAAWEENADKRVALGRRLRAMKQTAAHEIGLSIQFSALRERGAFDQARTLIDKELGHRPNDTQLLEMRQHIAADLGDFSRARELAMQLVDLRREDAVGVDLNNAAWYTIYLDPDPDAARQAERAVELDGGSSHLNTLAAVYASLGRWDDAANAMKKHVQLVAGEKDEELHPSFWYVRARVAEAFGRRELAKKLYRRVERADNGSRDDTYFLATKRLSRIGE